MSIAIHPADAAQAHAVTQGREATAEAITQINDGHARFMAAGKRTKQALIEHVNEARLVGIHLAELKKQTKHGAWLALFKSARGRANSKPVLNFDSQTALNYMRVSARLPNPVTSLPEAAQSLKDVMVMAGGLPASGRGDQKSRGTLNWLSVLQNKLMTATAIIGKQLDKADMRAWQRQEVEIMERHLRPFADRHKAAAEILKGKP
jgi:hypothetical protein